VFVMLRQSPRAFVERLDFRTSVGYGEGRGSRERLGARGKGVTAVITDIGVLEPDAESCELTLTALQPGATAEQAVAATGWPLKVAPELAVLEAPTGEELQALRGLKTTAEV
jgi:glutaconate CoA-transferase, subunit B